jgi:Dyp-type peroxidase family
MLDLSDIQGNILRGYRSFHFARFLFFGLKSGANGRSFVKDLYDLVTPGEWREPPSAATNVAFSFEGLRAFGLQFECLASFPSEFQEGMKRRASLLGDRGDCGPLKWDEPWRSRNVNILVTCYAKHPQGLDDRSDYIKALAQRTGITELTPHQDAALLVVDGKRRRVEHFGFEDGLSNPDVEGVPDNGGAGDTGNPDANGIFRKVPLGEFILGHRSEGGEVPPMPMPKLLVRNGSFLVVRKLEQHVDEFREFLRQKAAVLRHSLGTHLPAGITPECFLAAKMLGRWPDGSSLDLYPDKPARDPSNKFNYADDPEGARCPLGAHTRRVNGRASLGFGGDILRRRRLIRRGIAYGDYLPLEQAADHSRRGIMFLAFNASIRHQFEFVQQQWINYGDEFRQGDDTDPIVGVRYGDGRMVVPDQKFARGANGTGRMVIQGDERTGRAPFLCSEMPRFVTMKGGEYFFVPSLTGLRLLTQGEAVVP